MANYQFTKYSGSGNDFIIIDNREYGWSPTAEVVQKLCARRTGIGADGIVLVSESEKASLKMNIYNADGSEAEMCGNAARSVTHFAHKMLNLQKDPHYTIETMNGVYEGEYGEEIIRVKMTELHDLAAIDLSDYAYQRSLFLDTGVPHAVFQVDDVDTIDVLGLGRRIRLDERFPKGTNVDFFQVISEKEQKIKLRIYERGVEAETLCCGTGVMATAIACHKFFGWTGDMQVKTLGGDLVASVDESLKELYFAGSVSPVFSGDLSV
jgi:diaminopimelate epimerase